MWGGASVGYGRAVLDDRDGGLPPTDDVPVDPAQDAGTPEIVTRDPEAPEADALEQSQSVPDLEE